MFISTIALPGEQIGFSVPAYEKTYLLSLISPIQLLVTEIRPHPFPYILLHYFNQDRLHFVVNELHMKHHTGALVNVTLTFIKNTKLCVIVTFIGGMGRRGIKIDFS